MQSVTPRKIAYRIVAIALGSILAFVIAELGVRFFVPEKFWAFWDATTTWQLDPELGWVQKPNLSLTRRQPDKPGFVEIQTNKDGVFPASARREKPPGRMRIMMFGDSAVAGIAVPGDQRINSALERQLHSLGINAEVLNAGVNGYSTDQELLLLKRLVPLYHPDIVTLCIDENDLGANESRKEYGIPKPMFVLQPDGNLREVPPDMTGATLNTDTTGLVRRLIVRSALYRLVQPQIFLVRSRFMNWQERNVLGMPEIYYQAELLQKVNWNLLAAMLHEMEAFSRANGAGFLVYLHPAVEATWDPYIHNLQHKLGITPGQYNRYAIEQRMTQVTGAGGIRFCPLIDFFLARMTQGPFHLLPRDPHCNGIGYRLQAEALARFLLTAGLVARPAP